MKTLSLCLVLCLFCGCENDIRNLSESKSPQNVIKVIDGCEYIFVENSSAWANNYAFSLCHKGNCTNKIHVYNKASN